MQFKFGRALLLSVSASCFLTVLADQMFGYIGHK